MMAGAIVLLTVIAVALAVSAGHRAFRARVSRDIEDLFAERGPAIGRGNLDARRALLPPPVLRYLDFAIGPGARAIRTARLKHDGLFRTKPGQGWWPIEGEEYFTAGAPGFVWAAAVRAAPLVRIVARDRLQSGFGNMLVKICSTFTIADTGGPEMDQGAGLRWLAEAIWFPYAFVGDRVGWEPVDEDRARAVLDNGGLPVSMVVEVDDEGRLVRLSADRFRDAGGQTPVLTRWVGRCGDYQEFGGFRIPTSVEVAWDLEGGEFVYARFHVTAVEYDADCRW
jgi:hypothetical protein